jgi:ABC-2 type transport system ATP-binding protein
VRSLVRSLAADGATVFVSSHLLAEVEQICTHAAVMSAGRLVAQGTLPELRDAGKARIRLVTPDAGLAEGVFARLGMTPVGGRSNGALVYAASVDGAGSGGQTAGATPAGGAIPTGGEAPAGGDLPAAGVAPSGGDVEPEAVVAALVAAGVRVRGFAVEQGSLEDRFVALTGEGFDIAQ